MAGPGRRAKQAERAAFGDDFHGPKQTGVGLNEQKARKKISLVASFKRLGVCVWRRMSFETHSPHD